jgi:hypothetical protein
METFVIVTNADKLRPGLTYKVEIPNWAVDEWYAENLLLGGQRRFHAAGVGDEWNTAFTWIHSDGKVTAEYFKLTLEELVEMLRLADYNYVDQSNDRRQGRPEKRVLACTTSKERRNGSMNARGSY